ncbi:MAG: DUF86 domain-containing protein [Planctomycetes bacterium]|nr:DUF86 domain-containing protein [Planctomycetota bacterium]
MPKDDLIYVGHMLDTARLAAAKVAGITREAFDTDENLRLALAHLIQIIGEAARQVSPTFREAHPQTPWVKIIGMRHRVVHDYLHVDYDVVWGVVSVDLPALIEGLASILPAEQDPE